MLFKLKRQFQWFLDHYRREYFIAIITVAVNYAIAIAPPWFAGYIADRIFNLDLTMESLIYFVIMLLVLTGIYYATGYLWSYYLIKAYDVTELMARQRTMLKILNQNAPFFQAQTTGSLMGRSTNDINAMAEMAGFADRVAERLEKAPTYAQNSDFFYRMATPQGKYPWAKAVVVCIQPYNQYDIPSHLLGLIGRAYLTDCRADTASPGHIVKQGDEYLQFLSVAARVGEIMAVTGRWHSSTASTRIGASSQAGLAAPVRR